MGDFAIWVRGISERGLAGALVVETSDPDATRRALRGLQRVIAEQGEARVRARPGGGFTITDPEVPQPVHFAVQGERFVVAYGDDALKAAADRSSKLADNADFEKAAGSLGDGITASSYVDVQPILELVESFGPEPEFEEARPYLEPMDFFVAGAKEEGDGLLSRARLGFK
jgi:Protein of unknown function (DUF3352)